MPDFVCGTCGKSMARELGIIIPHTEDHIVDVIKKKHPEWIEEDGIRKKCYDYYKEQLHPEMD